MAKLISMTKMISMTRAFSVTTSAALIVVSIFPALYTAVAFA